MILPFFNGILSFRQVPMAWALFFINLFVYLMTFHEVNVLQEKIESYLKDDTYSRIQGQVFSHYIHDNGDRYPASLRGLADRALDHNGQSHLRLLGSLAMRDSLFLKEASQLQIRGDEVALEWWRKKFAEISQARDEHPSYNLGVTQTERGFERLLSYQFSHGGFSHFLGNMLFLLLFASCLEPIVGSVALLLLYLSSGVAAALSFIIMSEPSAIPLIGASGAVSGMMAFFCLLFWNRRVRYIYFLLIPKKEFAGFVLLPAWVVLGLWVISDLAGLWATPSEFGGIAYSAHLGGELFGALLGLLARPFLPSRMSEAGRQRETSVSDKPVP